MQAPAPWKRDQQSACPGFCLPAKRVVLVGASVRAAAESAARGGFCVTGIDLFGDRDTLAACHQHLRIPCLFASVASVSDGGEVPLAIRRIMRQCNGAFALEVGGLNSADQNTGTPLSQQLAKWFPSLIAAQNVRNQLDNPGFLRRLAVSAGIRFPRTLDKGGQPSPALADGPWLFKKHGSCGGLGIRWLGNDQKSPLDGMIQQWVPGRSFGATMLATDDDVVLLGVCRSLFARRGGMPFVYVGSFGPIAVSSTTAAILIRLGREVVASAGLRGLFNVDFLLNDRGDVWLLEINPRWSGSSEVVERRLVDLQALEPSSSLFDLLFQAIRGNNVSLTLTPKSELSVEQQTKYLKRVLFARSDVRFDQEILMELSGLAERYQATLHDIPVNGVFIRRSEPVLTLMSPIDSAKRNPMREHRVFVKQIHDAIRRRSEANYSPRSSA